MNAEASACQSCQLSPWMRARETRLTPPQRGVAAPVAAAPGLLSRSSLSSGLLLPLHNPGLSLKRRCLWISGGVVAALGEHGVGAGMPKPAPKPTLLLALHATLAALTEAWVAPCPALSGANPSLSVRSFCLSPHGVSTGFASLQAPELHPRLVVCAGAQVPLPDMSVPCTVRPGRRDDAAALLMMIKELADYEKELDQVQMTVEKLQQDGWPSADDVAAGKTARFETVFAEVDGKVVGFALFFHNYSTWEGMGLYLEDLYVKPAHRGRGVGTALMRAVASIAQARDCCRFQWQAIDFNAPAIEYYKNKLGARERQETGDAKWLNFIMDRKQIAEFAASK